MAGASRLRHATCRFSMGLERSMNARPSPSPHLTLSDVGLQRERPASGNVLRFFTVLACSRRELLALLRWDRFEREAVRGWPYRSDP